MSPNLRPAIIALVVALPAPLHAQWTQGGIGKVWVKSTFFWQKTDQEFGPSGDRRREPTGGESNSRAIYTEIIVGLLPTLDLWVQIPYLDLNFTSPSVTENSQDLGDLRFWLRWQVLSLDNGRTPVSLRAGAKAPLGFAPIDALLVPLGDGQWDIELFGEIGHSFWPAPAYAELWLGYRHRFENTETRKNPGEEFVFLVESGVNPTPWSLLKVTLDGFVGGNWIVEGVTTATARRILTLQLAGGVKILGAWLESGVRLPLKGQNFPAGPQLIIGASGSFSVTR